MDEGEGVGRWTGSWLEGSEWEDLGLHRSCVVLGVDEVNERNDFLLIVLPFGIAFRLARACSMSYQTR